MPLPSLKSSLRWVFSECQRTRNRGRAIAFGWLLTLAACQAPGQPLLLVLMFAICLTRAILLSTFTVYGRQPRIHSQTRNGTKWDGLAPELKISPVGGHPPDRKCPQKPAKMGRNGKIWEPAGNIMSHPSRLISALNSRSGSRAPLLGFSWEPTIQMRWPEERREFSRLSKDHRQKCSFPLPRPFNSPQTKWF